MKRLFTALFAFALASGLMIDSAYAARLGGGRSMGFQRSAPFQRQATPPATAPQQAKPAAPAAQPAGNRWLGPLTGLAAGLGLGWLLGQGGLGGFGSVLLMALLAIAVVTVLSRVFAGRREQPLRQMSYASPAPERAPAVPFQSSSAARQSGWLLAGIQQQA